MCKSVQFDSLICVYCLVKSVFKTGFLSCLICPKNVNSCLKTKEGNWRPQVTKIQLNLPKCLTNDYAQNYSLNSCVEVPLENSKLFSNLSTNLWKTVYYAHSFASNSCKSINLCIKYLYLHKKLILQSLFNL